MSSSLSTSSLLSPEIVIYDRTTFGSHLPFSKTLESTYLDAIKNCMYSFQFFLGSSKSYNRTILSDEDIKKTIQLQQQTPKNVFTHTSLIYNLAGSIKEKSIAWGGNKKVDETMNKIIDGLEYELEITSKLCGCGSKNGCVVHVGSWPDKKKGIEAISKTINKIRFPKGSSLLLENTAGKGTTIGKTFNELMEIYNLIDEEKKDNVKFCLDTCHIFASGEYDLRKEIEVDRLFSEFQSKFPLDKIGLIHFNDSFYDYNTQGDEHMAIGTGKIWKDNINPCKYILEKIDNYRIPLVLETYPTDIDTIQRL